MAAAPHPDPIHLWLGRLDPEGAFDEFERRAVRALVGEPQVFEARALLARPEQAPGAVILIAQGFACRAKDTADGTRQIISLLLPGDHACGAEFEMPPDHRIVALSDGRAAVIEAEAFRNLAAESPRFARAVRLALARETAIAREWIVNLGARSADARLAHLFCETMWRLRAAGVASGHSCRLMLRQQDMGDATGLSAVHVNRVLQKLRRAGLIRLDGEWLTFLDEERLEELADFAPDYLTIGRAAPAPALRSWPSRG